MPSGIIIIDKPADWTSQDVTAKLRGVFHERRIGHGGTLDPMATGVLPIFVGRATRGVEFFESADKEYVAGLKLGLVTDTQDVTGQTLQTAPVSVTPEQLQAVLAKFLGPQEQLPPMYSAIKVGGKKLYELAREGKTCQRSPRSITIFDLELLGGKNSDYTLRVHCSKGTYIRTLCHDIGAALGCGGCMSSLRRTRAGRYDLSGAVTMDRLLDLAQTADPAQLLLPVESLFEELPSYHLNEQQAVRCRNAAPIRTATLPQGLYRVYGPAGEFLMLGRCQNGALVTVKSFFEVK